jgi:ABC-2 type transport system permease protein
VFSIPPTNVPATVNMISAAIRFPVIFISGIFVPLEQLPGWAQAVAYISPLTYFTDIARGSIQGHSHLPVAVDLIALAGFTALFLAVAMVMHRKTMPRRI